MTSVLLTYPHQNTVSHSFHVSCAALREHDRNGRQLLAGTLPVSGPTGAIAASRNNAARVFLDATDAEWLWTVDTDMGFALDTLERLVDAADPEARPVMSALCFMLQSEGTDGLGGYVMKSRPVVLGADMEPVDFVPEDTVMPAHGVGAACLLIHRDVLAEMRDLYGDHWFTEKDDAAGLRMSEDVSFCLRLREMRIPIHVHTGIRTSHHKSVWISS